LDALNATRRIGEDKRRSLSVDRVSKERVNGYYQKMDRNGDRKGSPQDPLRVES